MAVCFECFTAEITLINPTTYNMKLLLVAMILSFAAYHTVGCVLRLTTPRTDFYEISTNWLLAKIVAPGGMVVERSTMNLGSIPSCTRDMSKHASRRCALGKALYTTLLTPPRCEWVPNFDAASQTMINCYQCEAGVFDTTSSHILSGDNPCLMNPNSTVTCPQSSQCYVSITTNTQSELVGRTYCTCAKPVKRARQLQTLTYAIERGCWDNYDDKGDGDTCDERRMMTNYRRVELAVTRCNGATGIHGFSVLALLPVAIAMFY
ncbi:hypothetical protein Bbelb_122380 [Branchiostoma belcheri]|nr:hypothetical protein Bbelb_122380 [Branchiostoma belcheri]